ncbi:MAG: hypothetical protein ABIU97_10015, partial [Dehalococcoidia bacterium]
LGSAGSLAKRAAPGNVALNALIETPAYRPFIQHAGVRYLSDPIQTGAARCAPLLWGYRGVGGR